MPFDYSTSFKKAYTYEDFLQRHGSEIDRTSWQSVYNQTQLSPEQLATLEGFRRDMKVLVMAGAWCGDCVAQCPAMQRFAEATGRIDLRFADSQTDTELAAELQLCGAARVPQVIFMAEDDAVVGRYGDRTLSRYRCMDSNPGQDPVSQPLLGQVVAEWLNEFERCQLILKTSPRLRRLHGE